MAAGDKVPCYRAELIWNWFGLRFLFCPESLLFELNTSCILHNTGLDRRCLLRPAPARGAETNN